MMTGNTNRRVVVSLTSYPARIEAVDAALQTIDRQTRPADEVVLWLAGEQFPEGEAALPQPLLERIREGRLTLRWCRDLKPHKKYLEAFRAYREDLVVTVDDDLRYSETLLEDLYQSYLRHPRAVSAARTHLVILGEDGAPMPYRDWVKETDTCMDQPSMQLVATGGAGALYPPELFPELLFSEEAILDCCPFADDLWLKAVELTADIPVVTARPYEELRYVSGTQAQGLYHANEGSNQNDCQWQAISAWMDQHVQPGILNRKLADTTHGTPILSMEAVMTHVGQERQRQKLRLRSANDKLKQTYAEKSELNARLKKASAEKSELSAGLRKAGEEAADLRNKLKLADREKFDLGQQLKAAVARQKELEEALRQAQAHTAALQAELERNPLLRMLKPNKQA